MKNNLKYIILLLICVMSVCTLKAQSKFGNATIDELKMTEYPNDTTADALILIKQGETRFKYEDGFQFEFTFQVKIKILKQEGLEWCNQSISYYEISNKSKEKITNLSGTVYNLEDGKITKTKLSKEYISDQDSDGKWKIKKFSLPGAKVGSVIEFKYVITSDFLYELREFAFQESIPSLYSSYEIVIPEYFNYNVNSQGYIPFDQSDRTLVNESFTLRIDGGTTGPAVNDRVTCKATKYIFKASNIPAMKYEPYTWTINDYISKVTFELKSTQMPRSNIKYYSTTWENIAKELLDSGNFGGNLKKTGLFKKDFEKVEPSAENARNVLYSIRDQVKWNKSNSFYPSNLNEALKTGLGNSADLNFLLINALNASGIEAYPVVISTRSNGLLPMSHPSLSAFNYCLTAIKIDTTMFFVDAADKYSDLNLLPAKCMVSQARVITPQSSYWVDLSTISTSTAIRNIQWNPSEEGYNVAIDEVMRGNIAHDFRVDFNENYKDQDEYVEKLQSKLEGQIENFSIDGILNSAQDIKVSYTLKSNIETNGEYIYISPIIIKQFSENPFKKETREHPISFDYLTNFKQNIIINIPDGYVAEEVPKSEKLAFTDNKINLSYTTAQQGNKILIRYGFQLNTLLFLQLEYEYLKDFYSKAVSKNNDQIVLKKIEQ